MGRNVSDVRPNLLNQILQITFRDIRKGLGLRFAK